MSYSDLTNYMPYSSSAYNTISDLERQITEIDQIIEGRKRQLYIFGNNQPHTLGKHDLAIFTNTPEQDSYYRGIAQAFLEQPTIDTQKSDHDKELKKKNKQIKELQKDNENLTRELEHEQIQSDNSRRIIEWLTDQRGSFYKSDVEEDDE